MVSKKIAKYFSISRRAVQNILMKLRDHNTIEDLPKTGCPVLNSARSARVLIRDSKKNLKKTAPDLLKLWKSSWPILVNTMKRILRNYKLFGRIPAKKPMLSGQHIHNRIQWCKSYGQLHSSFWNNIIFSDECRMEIYSRKQEYVRRPPGWRYDQKYITKRSNMSVKV